MRSGTRPPPLAHPCEPGATRLPRSPWRASPARRTPSGGCRPTTSAWRTSSWGASSTGRLRGRTPSRGCRRCNKSPRAWQYPGPRSTRPSAGGMAQQPRSGGPPASTGARARCPLMWPLCWHPSGTWAPSPSAAVGPLPHKPGPAPHSAGRSWSRGGTTRRKSPVATGWVSPTTVPSGASPGATGPSPRPWTSMQRPARCWPRPPGYTPCGMRCCLPQGRPRCPRSTSTPTRGTMPLRERGGSAAGCTSSFTHPDPGVRAPDGHPPRPPCPPPLPPPPPSRMRVPPPLLTQPVAQRQACPPARGRGCALHAWPADMQSHRDSHQAPPKRPVSLKVGPQITSNQILKSASAPPPQ